MRVALGLRLSCMLRIGRSLKRLAGSVSESSFAQGL